MAKTKTVVINECEFCDRELAAWECSICGRFVCTLCCSGSFSDLFFRSVCIECGGTREGKRARRKFREIDRLEQEEVSRAYDDAKASRERVVREWKEQRESLDVRKS